MLPVASVGSLVLQPDANFKLQVVRHETVAPASIIMMGFATAKIQNLPALYCCAKVQLQNTYTGTQARSLRWKDCIKGVPGGCFNPKSAMFDITYSGRHKHTKISQNSRKISLCGAKSEIEGERITRIVIDHILDAQVYLESTRTPEFAAAMNWLLQAAKGPTKIYTKYKTIYKKEFGTLEICKDMSDSSVCWPTTYPKTHRKIILEFLARSDDLIQKADKILYTDLSTRISAILGFTDIFQEPFQFQEIKLSSYIYFYDLGFLPNRNKLDEYLTENGYDSGYDGVWGHYIKVFMTTTQCLDLNKLHRKDLSGKQTFTFYPRGKVRHNGPNQESMAICYQKIMSSIAIAKSVLLI